MSPFYEKEPRGIADFCAPPANRRKTFEYDWQRCVGAYIDHLRSPVTEAQAMYIQERALTQRLRRDTLELEKGLLTGRLVDRGTAAEEFSAQLGTLTKRLSLLPSCVAHSHSTKAEEQHRLETILKTEIRSVLKGLNAS